MSEYLQADDLTEQILPEDDVTVAKGKVRVRGLARREVLAMRLLKEKGVLDTEERWEQYMVSRAVVAPKLTEAQVAAWQGGPAGGDLETVTERISELSGLSEGADKSGVQGVRGGPGDGVRVLPGDEAGHDGGHDAPPDAAR